MVEHGAQMFATRCASCHTEDGRGLIGPNLTDRYQLHGTTRMDIYTTIRGGVPGTAMLGVGRADAGDRRRRRGGVRDHAARQEHRRARHPQGQPVETFDR